MYLPSHSGLFLSYVSVQSEMGFRLRYWPSFAHNSVCKSTIKRRRASVAFQFAIYRNEDNGKSQIPYFIGLRPGIILYENRNCRLNLDGIRLLFFFTLCRRRSTLFSQRILSLLLILFSYFFIKILLTMRTYFYYTVLFKRRNLKERKFLSTLEYCFDFKP